MATTSSQRGFEGRQCLPKRISATGGIFWLDDAKEVPDTQTVSYDYGDMLLNFELRSFATDYLMPHTAPRIGPKSAGGPADFATAYYGTDATVLALHSSGEKASNDSDKRRYNRSWKTFKVHLDIVKAQYFPVGFYDHIPKPGFSESRLQRLAVEVTQVLGLKLHPSLFKYASRP